MSSESEATVRKLTGAPGVVAWALAVGLSLYALVWVLTIVEAERAENYTLSICSGSD